jgi:hypothetical protein
MFLTAKNQNNMTDHKKCIGLSEKYAEMIREKESFLRHFADRKNKETRLAAIDIKNKIESIIYEIRTESASWNRGLSQYRDYAEKTPKKFPEKHNYRQIEALFTLSGEARAQARDQLELLPNGDLVVWGGLQQIALFHRQQDGKYRLADEVKVEKLDSVTGCCVLPDGFLIVYGGGKIYVYFGAENHALLEYCDPIDMKELMEVRRLPDGQLHAIDGYGDVYSLLIDKDLQYLYHERIDVLDQGILGNIQPLPDGGYLCSFRDKITNEDNLLLTPKLRAPEGDLTIHVDVGLVSSLQYNEEDGIVYGYFPGIGLRRIAKRNPAGQFRFIGEPDSEVFIKEQIIDNEWILLPGNRILTTDGVDIVIWKNFEGDYERIQTIANVGERYRNQIKSVRVSPDGKIYTIDEYGLVRIFDGDVVS